MLEPTAVSRPHMPGYGIVAADEGAGLLAWSWAVERLRSSHDFWVTTVGPDGHPHSMPVWGVWDDDGLWFSSSNSSRRARHLDASPWCSATTDDALAPVVLEGKAERVTELGRIEGFLDGMNAKYEVSYDMGFMDPARNGSFFLVPEVAFGLDSADFTGTPTRWTF
jgi:hypothetical protein